MSNDSKTQSAIRAHGAQAVYNAAIKRMDGDRTALAKVGLDAANLGDANAIMAEAYASMGPAQRAIDAASAASKLP